MKRLLIIALLAVPWVGGVCDARAFEAAFIGDNAKQAAFLQLARTRALMSEAPKVAAELLELEELEMRDLVGVCEMRGDRSSVFFDSPVGHVYRSKTGEGTPALRCFLASKLPSRSAPGNLQQVSEFARECH